MIRITGGTLRGRYIDSPKNQAVRPTTGKVRESLFSSLQTRLHGARFLDLFAGSGLMGFEAVSRGAGFVMAVEKNAAHCRLIAQNAERLGLEASQYRLIDRDAETVTHQPLPAEAGTVPFDIVFMDAPYGYPHLAQIVRQLLDNGWLQEEGLIIAEQGQRDAPLPGFRRKPYGDTVLSLLDLSQRDTLTPERPE
jgi:16S rRNA (guanine966-N2)-methyltransferase